jgi:hypothetical protein
MTKPNPGSVEAIDQGCTCPVMDNNGGKGIGPMKDGTIMFWRSGGCPLHGQGNRDGVRPDEGGEPKDATGA